MRSDNWRLPAVLAAALFSPAVGAAQTQGDLGSVSRSTVSISASVAPQVRLRGFRDVEQTDLLLPQSEPKALDFCISANTSTRAYSVTAWGPSNGAEFVFVDATGHPMPFTVEWVGVSGLPISAELSPGVTAHGFSATGSSCVGRKAVSARLAMRLSSSKDQKLAQVRSDGGALTLIIAPE